MIIWGWRTREIDVDSGRFHCPECRADQDYKLVRAATYFTLYFIPLFETKHLGDYIKCGACDSYFKRAAPLQRCTACGTPYRDSDYRPDAATIFCSGCRAELPRRGKAA